MTGECFFLFDNETVRRPIVKQCKILKDICLNVCAVQEIFVPLLAE